MDKIITDKTILRKFGLLMALFCCLANLVIFIKTRQAPAALLAITLLWILCSAFAPLCLKYIYIFWMRLAYLLSWFNTRLLLGIMFYLIFSPIGLLMRLFKIDPMGKRQPEPVDSYWKPKENQKNLPVDYRRQS